MIKLLAVFIAVDILFSTASVKVPIFRVDSKRWGKETGIQRFCKSFFPPLIVFLIIITAIEVKENTAISDAEKMLEQGESQYFLISDPEEIKGADLVYEVNRDLVPEEVCAIIEEIYKKILKESSNAKVTYNGNNYYIKNNGILSGEVITSKKKYGMYLYFTWKD